MTGGARLSEDEIIARFFAPLATDAGADGLRDDAASVAVPAGQDLVVTQDALAAGVHFFPDDPPAAIAAKALRVNLSDLAAKGAEPFGYLLALALEDGVGEDWLEAFSGGLAADQARYGLTLLGGDTLKAAGGTTIAITAFGTTPAGGIVRRSGARPGEMLVLTGPMGDASLYLRERTASPPMPLDEGVRAALRDAYLFPQPPVAAHVAVRRYASAAMDVSDGLLGDLRKLARASGVGAIVDPAKLPLSEAGRTIVGRDPAAIETIMTGGDDYQILATIPAGHVEAFLAAPGVPAGAAVIGATSDAARGVLLKDGDMLRPIAAAASFQHF